MRHDTCTRGSSRKPDARIYKKKKLKMDIGHFFFYLLFSIMRLLLKIGEADRHRGRTQEREINNG